MCHRRPQGACGRTKGGAVSSDLILVGADLFVYSGEIVINVTKLILQNLF